MKRKQMIQQRQGQGKEIYGSAEPGKERKYMTYQRQGKGKEFYDTAETKEVFDIVVSR
jgi:hypothetical protein